MSSILDRVTGRTLTRSFLETARANPDRIALREKIGDDWATWTWSEYEDRVARAAAGLRRHGVEPGDRVVLMMPNRRAFHVLDMAVMMLGATPLSIYNSSSPEQISFLVGHCGATLGIAGDDSFLARFEPVRDELPELTVLGVVDAGERPHDFTFEELLAEDPLDLDRESETADPGDLATIIYTSGTTGPPKGVMLTHESCIFVGESLFVLLEDYGDPVGKRLISYLPMAHVAERLVSHYAPVMFGFDVSCCPQPGLIAQYATEIRPHFLFGVPRVWEKIHAGVMAVVNADPEKAEQFEEGLAVAQEIALKVSWGTATDEDLATLQFLDDVAFRGIRELLGLDQLLAAISGAAPLPVELLMWFRGIGVPMSEIYGLSENTGALSWLPDPIKPGTVGKAMPGTEIAIADDGEILAKGPHVFLGYLNDPEQTAEALVDGWLHTGDVGEIDDDGYLRIIDRKKELIITAGGKNVSPANLENALKQIPLVGQAAVVGDKKPFIAALVVLDPDTAPLWAEQNGVEYTDLEDLARNETVIETIEAGLPEVMESFSNAEKVKKVVVLGTEWQADSDILTPTSKLKRRGIRERFADEIESIYS